MPRLPYDQVSIEANKILKRLMDAKTDSEMLDYFDAYTNYLKAAGWNQQDFDNETLKRVSKGWENEKPAKPTPILN